MHELSDQELVAQNNRGLFTRTAGFEIEFFARGSSTARCLSYSDLDQCRRILIRQHADRVYIAEGADESPFHSLYWVTAAEYAGAWTDALARARAMPT